MKHVSRSILLATLPFLLTTPYGLAQMPQPPTQAEAQAALSPAPAAFTNPQLDQMLAPIALYPDQLLTQVLMASTFPGQLVDAQKWLQDSGNAALKGDDLANALQPLPWDPSVKSLVAFPQIIAMMTNHLDWTQALGTAFASQEVQVFARVQFLRDRAKQAGILKSSSQIAVSEQNSDIIIEPANPNEVYVPVYNPAEAYGAWPDNDYPPVYLPPPPGFYEGALGAGIGFSVGFGVVAPLWGWGHPDWRHHEIAIDQRRYQYITNQTFITENHINIEGGAWRRSGPIAMVPQAQRPAPTYHPGEPPRGTVQPSAVFRPGSEPGPGPRPPGEHNAPNAGPNTGPGPGPHPAEQAPPGGSHPAGEPPHPNEAQPGPHPVGESARPEENHPGGPPHPEEHGAPPQEHGPPPGQPQHPPEEHGPAPQEHGPPPGQLQHPPEEHAAPSQEHGPPAGQPQRPPEEHAPPPQEHGPPPEQPRHPPEEHAAPPQEHGPPPGQPQRPPQEHGPPPQAPHPPGPPQAAHPAPQQHPGGPQKPGEDEHH